MSWFIVVLILNLTFSSFSEARHAKKLPTPVVVGTVYCDTCFQNDFSRNSHFIEGASVAVECKNGNSKPTFWKEVRTNEHGEFRIELPFSVSKHVRRIKGCTVKLMKSSEPHCSVASSATSSLTLKSRNQREHTFSTGLFSFKPLQKPDLCNQNPSSAKKTKELDSVKTGFPPNLLPSPLQNPTLPNLPPLPELPPELPPLPQLPPLPPVPIIGIPLPPMPKHDEKTKKAESTDQKLAHPDFFFFPPVPFFPPPLIPNPLQPPPLIPNPLQPPPLIPNPFQPPPPLIPNPFQPPSPPLIPNPFQPPSPPPLIPNPFQPPPAPPAPLIPNPFQPPPAPPAPFFPNPFQPPPAPSRPPPLLPIPPSPLLPIPPFPGFTPSPPPPPPPAPFLPFPFPPLFPPPSHPSASSSKTSSP